MPLILPMAVAACCRPKPLHNCDDGTRPSPWCGYGTCNIFGCACKGGCRHGKRKRMNDDSLQQILSDALRREFDVNEEDFNEYD